MLQLMKRSGKVVLDPYVTTKHGCLRMRKSSSEQKLKPAVEDLAKLETLEEVRKFRTVPMH